MSDEKYCFNVSEEGQQGLDILDCLFNQSTQSFVLNSGLKPGMKVLDIGCGLGTMTAWLAKQVGPDGVVVAIDNNEYQIRATEKLAKSYKITNIKTHCLSAYDIEALKQKFDFVYCRFILHHINSPSDVIRSVYKVLHKNGVFAAEEGLVSQAFTYPFTTAWGNERWHNDPKDHDTEGKARDGNFGMKLFNAMHKTGLTDLSVNLVQPVMKNKDEKALYLRGVSEGKQHYIEQGHTKTEWNEHCEKMKRLVEDDSAIIAFYQSSQVSGVKRGSTDFVA